MTARRDAMSDAPHISADVIADVLTFGSLAALAPFYPQFADRLRPAKIGEPTATATAIQARLTYKILRDEGWNTTAILETILTRHYGGKVTPRAEKIVHNNAGSVVNKPADKLFADLRTTPARFNAARAALGLPPKLLPPDS